MHEHNREHGKECNCKNGKNDMASKGLALIAGAAIGAVVALLLAPKSGEEMREDLKDMAGDARKEFEKKKDMLKKAGKEVKDTIKKNFD